MNFKVQRYEANHPLFSNEPDSKGIVAVFGQFADENGVGMHNTMERKDTLIPKGTYSYCIYASPANKADVLLLWGVPGFSMIEHHIANEPHELKGCTAHGMKAQVKPPFLSSSGLAFSEVMAKVKGAYPNARKAYIEQATGHLIAGDILGTITYEDFTVLA